MTRSNIGMLLMPKLDANVAKDSCFNDKSIFAVEAVITVVTTVTVSLGMKEANEKIMPG